MQLQKNPVLRSLLCFVFVWLRGEKRLRKLGDADYRYVRRGTELTIFVPPAIGFCLGAVLLTRLTCM